MKNIEYDQSVDALYLQIEDRCVLDSEEIADGIIVDYDKDNNIVAVELLGVKRMDPNHMVLLQSLLPESVNIKFQEFFINLVAA